MGKIQCELCGSNEIVKENDMFVCKNCGTKYSVQEAQKLIGKTDEKAEITVETDKPKDKDNWLILARRARLEGNSTNAAKYYGMIVEQDPDDWEASFFQKYFQASETNLAGIPSASNTIRMAFTPTVELITKLGSDEEKLSALKTITDAAMAFADNITSVANNYIAQHSGNEYASQSGRQWIGSAGQIYVFLVAFLDPKESSWLKGDAGKQYYAEVCKRYNNYLAKQGYVLKKDYRESQMNQMTSRIQEVDQNYEMPAKSGSCYVATCVYGSYDCPEVWTLRRFRDYKLSRYTMGRLFIRCYYAISPKIIRIFGNSNAFRSFWKKVLDKMVHRLNESGYENTAYQD